MELQNKVKTKIAKNVGRRVGMNANKANDYNDNNQRCQQKQICQFAFN